jgi:hypothetical protein
MADIFRGWDLIVLGAAISFSLALIFLIFFRFPSTIAVIIIISCFLALFCLGSIIFLVHAEAERVYDLVNDDYKDVDMEGTDDFISTYAYRDLAYVLAAISGVIFLAMIVLLFSVRETF